jgi:hypothetical protein
MLAQALGQGKATLVRYSPLEARQEPETTYKALEVRASMKFSQTHTHKNGSSAIWQKIGNCLL